MQCIKCKKEIPDNSLRCSHCGIKVNMYCPECNTLNRFGSKYCSECGSELLKVCLKCGSNNLYYAEKCRKCGSPLNAYEENTDNIIIEEPEDLVTQISENSQNDVIIEEPVEQPKKKNNLRDFLLAQAEQVASEEDEADKEIKTVKEEEKIPEGDGIVVIKKNDTPETPEDNGIVFIKKDDTPETPEDNGIVFIKKDDTPAAGQNTVKKENLSTDIPAPPVKLKPKKIQNCITAQGRTIGRTIQRNNTDISSSSSAAVTQKKSGGGIFGFGKKKEAIKEDNVIVPPHQQEPVEETIQNTGVDDISDFQPSPQFEEESLIQVIDTEKMTEEKKNLINETTVSNEENNQETEENDTIDFSETLTFTEFTEPIAPPEPETPVYIEPENTIQAETYENETNITEEPSKELQEEYKEDIPEETPEEISQKEESKVQEYIHQTISTDMENHSFAIAKQTVINAIVNTPQSNIIAISGDCGTGKSVLLKQIISELSSNYSVIPLYSRCSKATQISCLGAFQDAFLSLLGLPACCANNINAFIKSNKASLKQAFPNLSDNEIVDFINFLYPNKKDVFANISKNTEKLFELINKIIRILSDNVEHLIIAIDNFDFIDGMSYEFLNQLRNNDTFNNKINIIITYQENKAVEGYFAAINNNTNSSAAKTIHLNPLTQAEAEDFMMQYINNDKNLLSEEMKKNIYSTFNGSGLCIEHYFALLYETGIITVENNFLKLQEFKVAKPTPSTIDLIIKERIKTMMPQLRNALFTAALLGYRFDNQIFADCMNVSDENANTILTQLKNILYTEELTSYSSTFKSYSVWKILEKEAKASDEYKDIITNIVRSYSKVIVSSPMNIIETFENEIEPSELITKLNEITSLIAALGDIHLYTIAQKQKLKFINQTNSEEYTNLAGEIYEEIGKLNYKNNPQDAIQYLSNAIARAQKINNPIKAIELCGYLVNSCYLTGNYYGVIETVDFVLNNASENVSELELALIKERKLKALLNIGNCEEIINLMTNEICVTIQDAILGNLKDENLRNLAATACVESNIILASAYAIQGNPLSFDVIKDIKNLLPTLNIQSPYFQVKTQMIEAIAFTSIGDINSSNEILKDAEKDFNIWNSFTELVSEWNLITLINKTLTNTPVTKEELFEIAAQANNSNEYFVKNIIKLILGYFIQKDGDSHKALEIYKEQTAYFSKEKNAIGSLIGWYLAAQATLVVKDAASALDVAQNALKVAQTPKINNHTFTIYLQKFIAEVYMSKGDLESTQMYLEKAMTIAQENGLDYAIFKILLTYSEYLEESLPQAADKKKKSEIALDIVRVHKDAKVIADKLNLSNLKEDISNAEAIFRTYCKLNNINLDVSNETTI